MHARAFQLRVRKPNGEPARDEPVKVAAVDYESGVRAEDVFVSNSEGEVYFVLPGELLLLSKELTLLVSMGRFLNKLTNKQQNL